VRGRGRGEGTYLGRGRASRSKLTFVAACNASIKSMTPLESIALSVLDREASELEETHLSSFACSKNCSPSALTLTTCFLLT
jgi:hypothetical protein